jgi:hypothetical protein
VQRYTFQVPDHDHPSGPLLPFVPEPLDPTAILGRTIDEWTDHAGSYGMGGPGFLGFCLDTEWLIVAIWGAGDWFRLDDRLVDDFFWEENGSPMPWKALPDVDYENLFVGRRFVAFDLARDSITAALDNGQILKLSPDPADRPKWQGSGEARTVGPADDLRSVVFFAPTKELCI